MNNERDREDEHNRERKRLLGNTNRTDSKQSFTRTGEADHSSKTEPSLSPVRLKRNVAAALSYLLFFVSGIGMYVLEDDDFVRFHATQSIVVFGTLGVAYTIFEFIYTNYQFGFAAVMVDLIPLLMGGLWVYLILTAYQGKKRRIPIATNLIDNLATRSNGYLSRVGGNNRRNDSEATTNSDPLAVLREQYIHGEIDDAEFERRLDRLIETDHAAEESSQREPEQVN